MSLDGFRFVHRVPVIFRDVDALGHVNNAVYLTYLETARLAYWSAVTGMNRLEQLGVILARVELDFRAPTYFGDVLDIGVRTTSVRRSSITREPASRRQRRSGSSPKHERPSSAMTTRSDGRRRCPTR